MSEFKPDFYFKLNDSTQTERNPLTALPPDIDSKHIAVVVPRGEVVRNFVHGGTLDLIAEKAEVSLVSVDLDDSIATDLTEKFGEIHPLIEYQERWLVRFEREILDAAHNRWLWSPAAQSRARLRDLEAVSLKQKIVHTSKKIISRPLANRVGLRALSSLERASSRALKTTDEYLNLWKKMRPSLVFNGSHVHSRVAIQAVQAAQWLKIPTATFIFSWDNLTSQGRVILPYDYYIIWNEQLKKQLLEMYRNLRPEQVFVTGTPQFDFHFQEKFYQSREDFCAEIGADASRPMVLYTTGMANHMPGEPELVEQIADMIAEIGGGKNNAPQLMVRVYPKDLTGRFESLKERRKDIIFPKIAWEKSWLTPRYEDSFALVNALRHCALGINVASTVSLELCMFDKPVINIGYNPPNVPNETLRYADYYDFDHYHPLVKSGAVELAKSANEMRDLIQQNLNSPERRQRERRDLMQKMFGNTLDGNSSRRVAQVLLEIAGRHR